MPRKSHGGGCGSSNKIDRQRETVGVETLEGKEPSIPFGGATVSKGQSQTHCFFLFSLFAHHPFCSRDSSRDEGGWLLTGGLKRISLGNQKYHGNKEEGRVQESKPIKPLINNSDHPIPVHVWI